MSGGRMFVRMLLRPLIVRRGSSAIAVLAVVVAATAATAMLTLFTDVQAKLRGDFRGYGANLIITSKADATLPADALHKVDAQLGASESAAPFGYVIAKANGAAGSEEHTSELQSHVNLLCRLLLEKHNHVTQPHGQIGQPHGCTSVTWQNPLPASS